MPSKKVIVRRKKRQPIRGRIKSMRIYKQPLDMKIHYFKRNYIIAPSTIKDTISHNSCNFQLALLPSYMEFTTLYDMYKINFVRMKFIFDKNESTTNATTASNLIPNIGIVKDYDDSSSLASINDYLQYQSFRVQRFDKPVIIALKPRMAMAAYGGAAFTSYTSMGNQWIDCDSSTVQHYGVKWYTDATMGGSVSNTISIGNYTIYVTVYLSMKHSR